MHVREIGTASGAFKITFRWRNYKKQNNIVTCTSSLIVVKKQLHHFE